MKNCFSILVCFIIFNGCNKETVVTENYLKFDLNNKSYLIYENASLNNDTLPNTFSYTFGESTFTESPSDTLIVLRCNLNGINIGIQFPKTINPQSYDVYRYIDIPSSPSCWFQHIEKFSDAGILIYDTKNLSSNRSKDSQKVGKINITKVNTNPYEFEGEFSFNAYGYLHGDQTITSTNDSIKITNGKFHYKSNIIKQLI